MVEGRGERERGVALTVGDVDVGLGVEQRNGCRRVADIGGLDKGRLARHVVGHVDGRLVAEEHLHRLGVAPIGSHVEGTVAVAVGQVEQRTVVEEPRGDVLVAVPAGEDEGGVAVLVGKVDVDDPHLEQVIHRLEISLLGRAQQREVDDPRHLLVHMRLEARLARHRVGRDGREAHLLPRGASELGPAVREAERLDGAVELHAL